MTSGATGQGLPVARLETTIATRSQTLLPMSHRRRRFRSNHATRKGSIGAEVTGAA